MSRTITFSKNVFLPLTNVCANACGYCSFKGPVVDGCVMPESEVMSLLYRGSAFGCTEALFTFGECPEKVPGFLRYIEAIGYSDILSYCEAMSRVAIDLGMLPHTNAGILSYDELARLRHVNVSMGLMLETTAILPAHCRSPGKDPSVRLEMIADAGKLHIPFTTGLLLGIGETSDDRESSLAEIRDLHKRYGHIQEVIIQNFCPKNGTEMAGVPGASLEVICEALQLAVEILPKDVSIQIPPNLSNVGSLLHLGVTDIGGISPVTIDYINPEHPWPSLDVLNEITGYKLQERLCVYPQYCNAKWISPELLPLVERLMKRVYG
ncbi:MAG TPA: 7,8-didemethyl-8-hydroxy-5-deazariboflavin synthase subunit CofG [Methanocorpusculum sp.]|nr:7,8-didemethyl-8-hydroxy-5-deazariboflavin synthase subunit CofG [Methanocorpusculum sp.]